MEKIFFLIFFVKNNSKSFEKKKTYHSTKPPIIVTDLTYVFFKNSCNTHVGGGGASPFSYYIRPYEKKTKCMTN